ncbi:LLM class flavin-dependent oxidoreductase [Streptomyces sp. NPDC001941]|uniref:LLM class flavin-dependent oxidoreductase n=1 Tax=Streptomyces sp. NPDC001941 TaxID=3154659 RepID=UPI0033216C58
MSLHLAAEIGGPPSCDAERYTALARLAEEGRLDFVTLDDSFVRPGLDALSVLSRVAPATGRIGLVPTVSTTHTGAAGARAAVAALDWVSGGRAGWRVEVCTSAAEAALFGRSAVPADEAWRRAGEAAEAARADWDRGRPGPPQGHPVVVADGTGAAGRDTAARHADVVLLRAGTPEEAAAGRADVHRRARAHGRDPAALRVLVSLVVDLGEAEASCEPGLGGWPRSAAGGAHFSGGPVELADLVARWHTGGAADGFHLVPIAPARDLERIVNGTVALLQHRGLFRTFHPGGTLREHLGLARPAARYATAGGPA